MTGFTFIFQNNNFVFALILTSRFFASNQFGPVLVALTKSTFASEFCVPNLKKRIRIFAIKDDLNIFYLYLCVRFSQLAFHCRIKANWQSAVTIFLSYNAYQGEETSGL